MSFVAAKFIPTELMKYSGVYFTPYACIQVAGCPQSLTWLTKACIQNASQKYKVVYRTCVVSSFWMLLLEWHQWCLISGSLWQSSRLLPSTLALQILLNSAVSAEIPFSSKSASCLINLQFHHSPLPSHNILT